MWMYEVARVQMLAELHDANLRETEANRRARMVLDNVAQGFLTVLPDATVQSSPSKSTRTWFGDPTETTKLWDYLQGAVDEMGTDSTGHWMELAWDGLTSSVLPLSFAIEQLPSTTYFDGRVLELNLHTNSRRR